MITTLNGSNVLKLLASSPLYMSTLTDGFSFCNGFNEASARVCWLICDSSMKKLNDKSLSTTFELSYIVNALISERIRFFAISIPS